MVFQPFLLASQNSYAHNLTVRAPGRITKYFSSLAWLFGPHNTLKNIRLSTYSANAESFKGLGYSGFARHYFRNRYLLSILLPTKMFQFGNLPLHTLFYSGMSELV
jgi:hypothetical protein